jgi:hypothetical protein
MDTRERTPLLPQANRSRRRAVHQSSPLSQKLLKAWRSVPPKIIWFVIGAILSLGIILFLFVDFRASWKTADYPPLPFLESSLRLIHLHPGSGSSKVEVTIEAVGFETRPNYYALSYTWGEDLKSESIIANGKKMRVTRNLADFLKETRHREKIITIWSDAVSIDQSNSTELSVQISLMASIYSRAEEVYVRLGKHTPPRYILEFEESEMSIDWLLGNAEMYWPATHYWLYRLIEEEYWKRCWIIQEIGMASNIRVFFGQHTLPWDAFIELIQLYRRKGFKSNTERIMQLDNLRRTKLNGDNQWMLHSLLDTFRDSFCSENIDHIYAFMGMATDCLGECITVDYDQPLLETYRDVILFENDGSQYLIGKRIKLTYTAALLRKVLHRSQKQVKKSFKWFGYLADPDSWMYWGCGDDLIYRCEEDRSGNTTANLFVMDLLTGLTHWFESFIIWPRKEYSSVWLPSGPEAADLWLQHTASQHNDTHVQVRGIIAGKILLLGPSYDDFLKQPHITREWISKMIQLLPEHLQKILALTERLTTILTSFSEYRVRNILPLDSSPRLNSKPRLFLGSNTTLGLVSANAKIDDILCRFWNSTAIAILRKSTSGHYEIVGSASTVAEGVSKDWDKPTELQLFESEMTIDLDIGIDALTRLSLDTVSLD